VDCHATLLVVVDHAVLVIPEHVHGRFRALSKCAHQPQCAAALNVQVRCSQDLGCRFCNNIRLSFCPLKFQSTNVWFDVIQLKSDYHTPSRTKAVIPLR
jgi:hypothetical protein